MVNPLRPGWSPLSLSTTAQTGVRTQTGNTDSRAEAMAKFRASLAQARALSGDSLPAPQATPAQPHSKAPAQIPAQTPAVTVQKTSDIAKTPEASEPKILKMDTPVAVSTETPKKLLPPGSLLDIRV